MSKMEPPRAFWALVDFTEHDLAVGPSKADPVNGSRSMMAGFESWVVDCAWSGRGWELPNPPNKLFRCFNFV